MPDDDLEAIREGVRKVCSEFDDAYWRTHDQDHEFPWDFYNAMAEGGWVGIAIPEEYGGGGRGITEASVSARGDRRVGRGDERLLARMHLSIFGMNPVVKHGSEEMQRRVPAAGRGRRAARRVRRHRARRRHRHHRDHDAGRARRATTTSCTAARSGRPRRCTAEKVLLLVRTTPLEECAAPHRRHDAAARRPAAARGRHPADPQDRPQRRRVVRGALRRPARRGQPTGSARRARASTTCSTGSTPSASSIAAEALGIGRAAMRRAVAYANERVVFGRPIGQNQGIAFPLAEAHARLHAAELAVREAAWRYDQGLPCGEQANIGQVPRRRGRLLRRRPGHADPRRVRLRDRVRRRALLARGSAHAHRADQPGDDPRTTSPSTCSACRGRTDGRTDVARTPRPRLRL